MAGHPQPPWTQAPMPSSLDAPGLPGPRCPRPPHSPGVGAPDPSDPRPARPPGWVSPALMLPRLPERLASTPAGHAGPTARGPPDPRVGASGPHYPTLPRGGWPRPQAGQAPQAGAAVPRAPPPRGGPVPIRAGPPSQPPSPRLASPPAAGPTPPAPLTILCAAPGLPWATASHTRRRHV